MSDLAKALKIEGNEITSRLSVKKIFDDIFGAPIPQWNVIKIKSDFKEKNIRQKLQEIEEILEENGIDEFTKRDLQRTREELIETLSDLVTKTIPASV